MNRFSSREKNIIKYLYDINSGTTGASLSLYIGCSLRTVQGEISAINHIVPGLILSSNKGYSLDYHLASLLEGNICSGDENEGHVILRRLLIADKNNNPWQIDELAEYMYMSTPRLEKELLQVTETMSRFSLKLHRHKGFLSLSGTESQKRAMMHYLVVDETANGFHDLSGLKNYFPDMDIPQIKELVTDAIYRKDYYIENIYLPNVIVNIVIALDRMRCNNYISPSYHHGMDTSCGEYLVAEDICQTCTQQWNINPTEMDIAYIASLLMGQIRPRNVAASNPQLALLDAAFTQQIQDILVRTFHEYLLNVDIDSVLYGFAMHVDGLIKRSGQSSIISNEIISNMKRGAPFVYDVSVSIAQKIQEAYGIEISDAEIGYISIHIGFLIEQSIERSEKVYILFFSEDYHQIGASIEEKLHENFDTFARIQTVHEGSLDILSRSSADLILTTTPIPSVGKNVLLISPFYTMMDHINIDQAIHRCLKEKELHMRNAVIASFFDEQLFFKDEPLTDKYDVIRFLGNKIVAYGIAGPAMIDSAIRRERMSSTCFLDTFAIPHAEEMDATQTMCCVLISKKGIKWDTQTIHIVMMIAVNKDDRPQFMKIYNGIVQAIAQPDIVSRLVAAKDYRHFMKILMEQ